MITLLVLAFWPAITIIFWIIATAVLLSFD